MNVAYIISKSEIGGAQTWVKDQISLFEKEVSSFLITNKPGWLSQEVNVKKTLFLPGLDKGFKISHVMGILRFLKENNIKLIVASSANAGVYARLIKPFYKDLKVVYVSHGWSCIYNGGKFKKVFVSLERLLSIFTDAVLCVSKKDREDARNIIGIRDNKLHYIRNGVYPKVKNENAKTEKFLRIIFLGRLTKPKRPDLLIEAVKGMDNVKLDIIGSGDLECQLPRYDNVSFLGEVGGFDNFCNYDLFALISDSEGMPMSALEAASAGVPIVISDVGGCSEIITDNGILVLNDVYSIRKAIEHIIENYTEIKGNSLRAAKYFDINNSKLYYSDLYSKL